MTIVRLAWHDNPRVVPGLQPIPGLEPPALLVSFWYLESFEKRRHLFRYRDWVMDSGAFSAHNSGVTIDIQEYIDTALRLQASDPTLTEIYALDVIGDPDASLRNCEEMVRQGVRALPTFHMGSPWSMLDALRDYPKIALGGMVGKPRPAKQRFIEQAFARLWPMKIHGFGLASEDMLLRSPFHSADASSWELAPTKFGSWKAFGKLPVRGAGQDLRPEVEWYLKMERRLRAHWAREMSLLERQP